MASTVTIRVPEIHCEHCKQAIETALTPLDGVHTATVDVSARQVTVAYDGRATDRNRLVAAIEAQGYEVPA